MSVRFFDRALSAPAGFASDGRRTVAPAVTLRRARRLMAPLGITRLADLTGLDDLGLPVFSAIRPNGKALATSQGKGVDPVSAQVSALMESIETWHAENVALPRRRASCRALRRRGAVIDVARLPRRRGRLDLDARWSWVEGWDLVAERRLWVPLEAVTLDTTFADPPVFDVSSNGLASGNHPLEAIAHAIAEVIERDAEARWRRERGDLRVDLDAIVDPTLRALLDRLRAAGVFAAAFDLTTDVDVPVYGCALIEDPAVPAWRSLGLYQGFGCHLVPEIALGRALTEAVQTRVTYIAGSRDDFFADDYERATDPEMLEAVWGELTRAPARTTTLAARARRAGPSIAHDVATLRDRLVATGSRQIAVVDLTRSAARRLGLAVVKALVPGRATAVEYLG